MKYLLPPRDYDTNALLCALGPADIRKDAAPAVALKCYRCGHALGASREVDDGLVVLTTSEPILDNRCQLPQLFHTGSEILPVRKFKEIVAPRVK
jgi:hypothetical protein